MVQNKFCRNFRSGKFLCSVACAADANVRFGAWLNAFVASNTVVVCIKLLNSSNSDSIKKYVIIFFVRIISNRSDITDMLTFQMLSF